MGSVCLFAWLQWHSAYTPSIYVPPHCTRPSRRAAVLDKKWLARENYFEIGEKNRNGDSDELFKALRGAGSILMDIATAR
jgi:hypothetical protein